MKWNVFLTDNPEGQGFSLGDNINERSLDLQVEAPDAFRAVRVAAKATGYPEHRLKVGDANSDRWRVDPTIPTM